MTAWQFIERYLDIFSEGHLLQDDFWEASSLGLQSSFSKAWYLEEDLVSI